MARLASVVLLVAAFLLSAVADQTPDNSLHGIQGLADRLFNGHSEDFEFSLTTQHENWSRWNAPPNDNYTVSVSDNGKIHVQGTTLSALARG